jgi:riboflavin synthase
MFTGLICDVGTVERKDGGRFVIATAHPAASIAVGASIACDGCCLTVVGVSPRGEGANFWVDVSNETLSKTTLGSWNAGRRINLERSLKAGEEIGGHLVSGHVDGVARIIDRREDGASIRFHCEAPEDLSLLIAPKGSVALDGTSLTVNEVEGTTFGVNIIPHTAAVTTWGERRAGDLVNLEVDVLARYVARLLQHPV